jgi:acyl dehydratase
MNTPEPLGSHERVSPRLSESLYHEDIVLGQRFRTREHLITDEDIARFGEVTLDHHPLHSDDAFAQRMGFPRRIAHGLFSLSLMEGLKSELGLYESTSVASLGWDAVRFRQAVVSGDAVHVRVSFIASRLNSKGTHGIVTEQVDLCNAQGVTCVSATHAALLIRRP